MCGIIGIIGKAEAAPLLLAGLKRLEYRGYDSAGIATLVHHKVERRRAEGKLAALEAVLATQPLSGTIGIGHTRWATHGAPNTMNAHPHATEKVAVVHNGIIENFKSLRAELEAEGVTFTSETDTEVVPHLVTRFLHQGKTPTEAVEATLAKIEGAFALAMLFAGKEDLLIAARRGSPLAIGYGEGEMFIASDAYAMAPLTKRICYLEEGDWAVITRQGATIYDEFGDEVQRDIRSSAIDGAITGKGNYPHYMLKEIYEQPAVIGATLKTLYNALTGEVTLPPITFDLARTTRITIIACGTSYYAGMVAKYWLEQIARVPVELDIASEFRYREPPLPKDGIGLFISQSGETADTLAALKYAKLQGQYIVSLVNAEESSMARLSDVVLKCHAGPEIGVASTKAFTTQLTALACFTLAVADERGTIDPEERTRLCEALVEVPARAAEVLHHDERLRELAEELSTAQDILYIGRGTSYPVALEGALKLKEISYIHAEGIAAGELKHGPIALIDDQVPVVVIAPYDTLFEKTASNVQEVVARGGKVTFLSDPQGVQELRHLSRQVVELPKVDPFVAPILYAIPMQLLAYHVAVLKGTDVDQPRNLAKSVTVE